MSTRAQVKAKLRTYLGTDIDDPAYGDTDGPGLSHVLDPIVQEAVDSLVDDIYADVPGYAPKVAILAAANATSHIYPFISQTPPIGDFSHWLKVRFDSENGTALDEVPWDDLSSAAFAAFAIAGADDQAVLQTSLVTDPGHPLWIEYGFRPAPLVDDTSNIPLIPAAFHDVVALEALYAFELGGESVLPAGLRDRWVRRRAQLFERIRHRGTAVRRTRLDPNIVASYS